MASKLIAPALQTGLSPVFVRRRQLDGAYWNTSGTPAFEAYNAANIANYAIAATEDGSSGQYSAADPAEGTPGPFLLIIKAGGSLAVADLVTPRYEGVVDVQTGDSFARLGAPAGASVSADIASIPTTIRVKKNTALAGFMFPMVDSTDHATPETGLTVTATRSLDGAAFASCANSVSEISAGVYKIDLAAGDLNGNVVTLKFTATGADQRLVTIVTQP